MIRRVLGTLAAVVLGGTLLAGCHGGIHVVTVISGLEFPAAFTIEPGNAAIWYGERFNGEIHRRELRNNQDTLVFDVSNLLTSGEQGLLGVAVHPSYPSSPFVYAYASRNVGGARNQILKITVSNGVGVSSQVIMDDPGIASFHNGGRILFGPDGNLYAVVGEHGTPANAQTVNGNTNLAGKVLRMTPDGTVPADNPVAGSFVWAQGIRNSFGFAFDPTQGNLWLTDNGPNCNDEVNRIVKGGNYAWGPEATCNTPPAAPQNTNQSGPAPRLQPVRFYPAMGITGAAFCATCGLSANFQGRVFTSAVNNGQVHSLTLDAARTSITNDTIVYDHPSGVLSLETRPGNAIYFSDSTSIYRLSAVG